MTLPRVSRIGAFSAAITAALLLAACSGNEETPAATETSTTAPMSDEVTLESSEQKVTYIVGYNMAQQAKANGLTFDTAVMARAIQDVNDEQEPRIAQAEQQQIMMAFQEEQQAKRDEERQAVGATNMEASKEFLAENAQKDGVTTTESGLQYRVITEGPADGASPTADDTVQVHYHGTLADGEVFDSSVDRGQPVSFPVQGVIPGWIEGLQLMSVGDKYELVIPPDLAYGEQGTSGKIGPNQALVFEVELLAINPDASAPADAEEAPAAEAE